MTSASDDFVHFLEQEPSNFGYRQGLVVAWDDDAQTNQITVAGSTLTNLPTISMGDVFNIRVGDTVAVIKYNDSYAVIGRIRRVGPGSLWMPIVLYPQFAPLTPAGTGAYAQVPAGTLVTWEGRAFITHHRRITVDGIWGQASGANTSTFELQIGGATVAAWTQAGSLSVANKGPYDVSQFRDQANIKVEVKITSSVGSGNVAIQVLACFLR